LILVLFTHSYPYDFAAEQTFLEHEISHLQRHFDKVLLVPRITRGNRLLVPSHVEVEESLANQYRKNVDILSTALDALGSLYFRQELRSKPRLFLQPFKLAKLLLFSGRVAFVMKWFKDWLEAHPAFHDQALLYTYWFDEITTGLGLVEQEYPRLKLVSRAHGYDIYEEDYFPYYWPLRRKTLAMMDKLFLASYNGRDYFCKRYPEFSGLFETAHLGTEDPGFISSASTDGVFRIVSCAHILPLKRIDLLCEGIAQAATTQPQRKFEWHHFGDGKGRQALQKLAEKLFPSNATGNFPGYVPNWEIMKHYQEKPVDIFVNLSTTEGGAPVAIQEAISCGIPVIATHVGGNPEIVSERNGILLKPNPTPKEVAEALIQMSDIPDLTRRMRAESRLVWEESYNAEVNFRDFAEKLKAIWQN
jgi:colanic acid/amylovoran biosynthesis glycosyltransferase